MAVAWWMGGGDPLARLTKDVGEIKERIAKEAKPERPSVSLVLVIDEVATNALSHFLVKNLGPGHIDVIGIDKSGTTGFGIEFGFATRRLLAPSAQIRALGPPLNATKHNRVKAYVLYQRSGAIPPERFVTSFVFAIPSSRLKPGARFDPLGINDVDAEHYEKNRLKILLD